MMANARKRVRWNAGEAWASSCSSVLAAEDLIVSTVNPWGSQYGSQSR